MNKEIVYSLVGASVGVALVLGLQSWQKVRPQKKLLTIRRIGDRIGRPIVAAGWKDVLQVFPGRSPRVFLPNGDEILSSELTYEYFHLLPTQQLLYIAPNGEDFNPIEVLERLDEQQVQYASEMYNRLVDLCFKKCVPHFRESDIFKEKGEEGVVDFVKHCVNKFNEVSRVATNAFSSPSGLHNV